MNGNEELLEAFRTLGLDEHASREEVEKRYGILLKRERNRKLHQDAAAGAAGPDFETVNSAYRTIMEWETRKTVTAISEQQYGKYKRFSGQAQKFDHFISYYKWHLLGAIALVALIIYGITAYVDYRHEQARLAALPPVDAEGMILGQFYLEDQKHGLDKLEQTVVAQVPGWKRVEFEVLSFNMNAQDQMDYAMQQKVMVELATSKPDLFIMDRDTYLWIARSGVLRNLDAEAEGRLKALLPAGAALKAPGEAPAPGEDENKDIPEHVYGIDVSDSSLAKSLPIAYRDLVIGIRVDAKHKDNVLKLIETYLQAK